MKSGFIAVVGRPSTGKSTLINTLCGEKVCITSEIPQTTRTPVRGILTTDAGQAIFLDTPGFFDSDKKFNKFLVEAIDESLKEADSVLYIADGTRFPGKEENIIMSRIALANKPVTCVINKIDLSPKRLPEIKGAIHINLKPDKIFEISALKGEGVLELKRDFMAKLPEGELLYPEDIYTDQPPAFRISEIIREKVINAVDDEIPHSVYVDIADMEMKENGHLWVRAFIVVERESQKGIVIGKGGKIIKWIRIGTMKDLKKIFSYKIDLDLYVKAESKWRQNDITLKRIMQIE